jgi:tetratricopeptide (TPR) repeat protein/predicted AlkP superfamily phosphohydrolase/phosphomutase
LKPIAIFIICAIVAVLLLLSIKIVGTDEVALVGSGSDTRELSPGTHFVGPFTRVRRIELRQEHDLTGERALAVSPAGMPPAKLECRVTVEIEREKALALDRQYPEGAFDRLVKPILKRELSAFLAAAGPRTGADELPPDALVDAGPQIAAAVNARTVTLGITVAGLSLEGIRERPPVTHDLKRGDGVKVFILGLDGYDWLILDKVSALRELPNIERIRREGAWGNLRSLEPLVSPLIWTTMVTGVTPDVHGITDFLVRDETTGEDIPITSSHRMVPALWNITSLFDLTCGFIGWFASFPAEEVKGFVVSDRFGYHMFDPGWVEGREHKAEDGVTYPVELYDEIADLRVGPEEVRDEMSRYIEGTVSDYKTGEDGLMYWQGRRPDDPQSNLRLVISAYRTYEQVMKRLYPAKEPDLFGIYFEFTDSAGHLFMKFMKPAMSGVDPEDEERYGEAIAATYAEADRIIGEVLDMLDDQTVLLIVSDHGFKSGDMRPLSDSRMGFGQAIEWHRINGAIAMYGGMVKPGHEMVDASVMDIAPTLLYLLGLPVDRKMTGNILFDALDENWVQSHPVSYTTKYDSLIVGTDAQVATSAADQALKDKLISLGYVAGGNTALVNLANYYHKNGKYEEAVEVYRQLIELEPDNLEARIGMSSAYSRLGEMDLAVRGLNEVLERAPRNLKALHSLATVYVENGRPDEALAAASRAVDVDATSGESHFVKGLSLQQMGRYTEAESSLRQAIKFAPDLAEAHANLAEIYVQSGRGPRALEHAERALELAPGRADVRYILGLALNSGGRSQEALDQFRSALDLNPEFVPAYIGASGVLLAQGKTDSVIALCAAALEIESPYAAFLYDMRGSAHALRGEQGLAIRDFKDAIRADNRHLSARINLAKVYASRGQTREAREELQTVLSIDPANPTARAVLRQLGG